MSNNTSEALRLARMIEHYNVGVESQRIFEDYQQAAAELRHLYDENEAKDALLRQALECLERSDTLGWQANLPVIQAIKERLK